MPGHLEVSPSHSNGWGQLISPLQVQPIVSLSVYAKNTNTDKDRGQRMQDADAAAYTDGPRRH